MNIRVQARKRVDLGVAMMAAVLLLLGAQQIRIEAATTNVPAGDSSARSLHD